jgi:hypothetical protein
MREVRASPAMVASLVIQKVQLTTLATAFSLYTPTDLLFYNLLPLKYYFSFFFYYIFCQHSIKEKTNIYIKSFIKTKNKYIQETFTVQKRNT